MVSGIVIQFPRIRFPNCLVWRNQTGAALSHSHYGRLKCNIKSTETHPGGEGRNDSRVDLSKNRLSQNSGEDASGVANIDSTRNHSR